jgi:hemerythrin-like domain-containing protein
MKHGTFDNGISMPIVIGSKPESTFADPVGLLTDCHRRIERFLGVLVQISGQTKPLTDDQRASLETALRYFREAAPKHTADEEESLFPRLRALESAEIRPVLQRIEALESEHDQADRIHAEIEQLGQSWLAEGSLPAAGRARFSELVSQLAGLYRSHIALEEGDVFPAASILSAPERAAIGREMAGRRSLRPTCGDGPTPAPSSPVLPFE